MDFVVSIVFMCEETLVNSFDHSIALLEFTTCLLNQACHNQSEAWKPLLQFVNDMTMHCSKAKELPACLLFKNTPRAAGNIQTGCTNLMVYMLDHMCTLLCYIF